MIKNLVFVFFFFLLVILKCDSIPPENRGTDFFVAFGANTGTEKEVSLYISSELENTIKIESKSGLITTIQVAAGSTQKYLFNYNTFGLTSSTGQIQTKGIRVYSTTNVVFSVIGLNYFDFTTDGFLAYPVNTLGKKYITLSYRGFGNSFVYMVGTEDATQVTITSPGILSNGMQTRTLTLDKFSALIEYAADDISGAIITSDKPIAVFGGSLCANVPNNIAYCNHLVEQIPSTNTWDKKFLTSPFKIRKNGDIIRVMSGTAGTTVKVNGAVVATIDVGNIHEFSSSVGNLIETSEPALVAQYSKGGVADGTSSDPFQVMIAPVTQYNSNYIVMSPVSIAFTHFVNIVIKSGKESGLKLDGQDITSPWIQIGSTGYVYSQLTVSGGSHTIRHDSPIESFQVTCYGYGKDDGYGYLGGSRFTPLQDPCTPTKFVIGDGVDNDCDGLVDEELKNGKDDDGDGKIDEDIAGTFGGVIPISPKTDFRGVAAKCVYPPSSTKKACFKLGELFDELDKDFESITCKVEDCNLDNSVCWAKKKKAKSADCKWNASKQTVCVEIGSCDVSYKYPCIRYYEVSLVSGEDTISSRIAIPISARSLDYDRSGCSATGKL